MTDEDFTEAQDQLEQDYEDSRVWDCYQDY